ncbi:HIRA-interacting protein 3 isoform X2 [Stigmatopora nigra]
MSEDSESKDVREFVQGQLRDEQDLSSLTLGILKKRYLANVGSEVLSLSTKNLLKQIVQEELANMMENKESDDVESETEDCNRNKKRKRNEENESDDEHASKHKKSSCETSPKSESEEEADSEIKESPRKTNGKCDKTSEDQSDNEAQSFSNKNDSGSQSSEESVKEAMTAERPDHDDSDSPSLPSSEDEQQPKKKEKQANKNKENDQDLENKKSAKKDKEGARPKEKADDKTIVRLKRYISLCGVRRNYKSLLGRCKSVRSMVAVLKKELEDLGVSGQPSIEKCKKARLKRENARELAELDARNIIKSEGRPKRRAALARPEQSVFTYHRSVNSDSDSNQEGNTCQGNKRTSDWANLKGIISDDASSE